MPPQLVRALDVGFVGVVGTRVGLRVDAEALGRTSGAAVGRVSAKIATLGGAGGTLATTEGATLAAITANGGDDG